MKIQNLILSAACACSVTAGAAMAENLRYAIGFPPGTEIVAAIERIGDVTAAETDGALNVRVFPLALLNWLESPDGLRDGLADLAGILPQYVPASYPMTSFLTEMSSLVDLEGLEGDAELRAGVIFGSAFTEYLLLHCPSCIDEFRRSNSLPLAGLTSSSYALLCTRQVTTPEELAGRRIRVGGGFWARWVEEMNAVPVSISANETFEALSQGMVDCTAHSTPELIGYSLIDVVSDVTLGVPGAGFAAVITAVNMDVWGRLSTEKRTALLRGAATVAAGSMWVYYTEATGALDAARERGVNIHLPSEELLARSVRHIEADVETTVADFRQRYGIEIDDTVVDHLRELIQKWAELVVSVDNVDELTELMWQEVMSQIDPEIFGL